MKLIAIDTSGKRGSLAALEVLEKSPQQVHQTLLPDGIRSARSLAPCLSELLRSLGWAATDLDRVAVTSGPGSFTGLRVGVTAAKMLAYVAGCDVVEVNTLAVMAAQVTEPTGPVWAAMDAQRGEVFAACFAHPTDAAPTQLMSAEEWISGLQPGEMATGPILMKLKDRLPPEVAIAPEECWLPEAESVARLAISGLADGGSFSPVDAVPRYFRLSAAEEKAQLK